MNIWHDISPKRIKTDDFFAVIEITKGGKAKYEMDKETGLLRLDRVYPLSRKLWIYPPHLRQRWGPSRCAGALFRKYYPYVLSAVLPYWSNHHGRWGKPRRKNHCHPL